MTTAFLRWGMATSDQSRASQENQKRGQGRQSGQERNERGRFEPNRSPGGRTQQPTAGSMGGKSRRGSEEE